MPTATMPALSRVSVAADSWAARPGRPDAIISGVSSCEVTRSRAAAASSFSGRAAAA
ncbi:hypothetical protein AZA_51638 [Nitrospirillum viridazoti Y2]|nr:hypothetical protein AZA_51638 [Nitrospirillum amazonense Y2]